MPEYPSFSGQCGRDWNFANGPPRALQIVNEWVGSGLERNRLIAEDDDIPPTNGRLRSPGAWSNSDIARLYMIVVCVCDLSPILAGFALSA